MLCLMRKTDQVVIIKTEAGERIEVMVTSINRNQVVLGFTAAKSIQIARAEVFVENPKNPCEVCGKEIEDYEPEYCCNAFDCPCAGKPLPAYCSQECGESV